MFEITKNEDLSLRDQTILEFLHSSGIRVSEMLGLKVKNLNLAENYAKVFGKTRWRTVNYSCRCAELFTQLIPADASSEEYVFYQGSIKGKSTLFRTVC
jgi:site-specific recombinase XerC